MKDLRTKKKTSSSKAQGLKAQKFGGGNKHKINHLREKEKVVDSKVLIWYGIGYIC